TLPVDFEVAGVLGVERALAVTQPADECAAALLAEHVAVRLTPGRERTFDHARESARHPAEQAMAGIEDFIRRVAFGRLGERGGDRQADQDRENEQGSDGAHGYSVA